MITQLSHRNISCWRKQPKSQALVEFREGFQSRLSPLWSRRLCRRGRSHWARSRGHGASNLCLGMDFPEFIEIWLAGMSDVILNSTLILRWVRCFNFRKGFNDSTWRVGANKRYILASSLFQNYQTLSPGSVDEPNFVEIKLSSCPLSKSSFFVDMFTVFSF